MHGILLDDSVATHFGSATGDQEDSDSRDEGIGVLLSAQTVAAFENMSLFDIFTDAATQTGMPLKPQNSVLSLTGQVNHLFGEDHRFGG